MKKLMLGLAPLLAVAAFAIAPAAASARTDYGTCGVVGVASPQCPGTEHFTAFGAATKVIDKKATGSGNFVLEEIIAKTKITCKTLSSIGTDENIGGVGKSTDTLFFDGCELSAPACRVNSDGADEGDIIVEVTNEVVGAEEVKVTLTTGVPLEIPGTQAGCVPRTELGEVTGAVTGTQKKSKPIFSYLRPRKG